MSKITKELTQGGTPQRAASYFLDERTNALGNEDTFMTLLSMRNFFPADSVEKGALDAVAKEESRYMVRAAQILHGVPKSGADAKNAKTFLSHQSRLQNKFGRDMQAVADLAKVLKNKIEDKETDDILVGVAQGLQRSDPGELKGALTGTVGEAEEMKRNIDEFLTFK